MEGSELEGPPRKLKSLGASLESLRGGWEGLGASWEDLGASVGESPMGP